MMLKWQCYAENSYFRSSAQIPSTINSIPWHNKKNPFDCTCCAVSNNKWYRNILLNQCLAGMMYENQTKRNCLKSFTWSKSETESKTHYYLMRVCVWVRLLISQLIQNLAGCTAISMPSFSIILEHFITCGQLNNPSHCVCLSHTYKKWSRLHQSKLRTPK